MWRAEICSRHGVCSVERRVSAGGGGVPLFSIE